MDKNSVIGLLLIGAIFLGYNYVNQPTEEEIAAYKRKQDSIAQMEAQRVKAEMEANDAEVSNNDISTPLATIENDSVQDIRLQNEFGIFANSGKGSNEFVTLENEKIKLTIATKGAKMVSAELKEYHTYDSLPLLLFDEATSDFGLNFTSQNRFLETNMLYFDASEKEVSVSGNENGSLVLRAYADSKDSYIEFIYGLKGDSYLVDYDVNVVGLGNLLRENSSEFGLSWEHEIPSERKRTKERKKHYFHFLQIQRH